MKRYSLAALTLTVLVGMGAARPARADGPGPYGQTPYIVQPKDSLTTHVVIPPDPLNPEPKKRFGCWAHHNYFGCGSFRSDMVFIFGSCRSFFGEGCRKDPPSIYPPGYGPAGYVPPASAAGGNSGCNCQW